MLTAKGWLHHKFAEREHRDMIITSLINELGYMQKCIVLG